MPILVGVTGVLVLIVGLCDLAAMRSIAVLPFANISTNKEAGFLAEGFGDGEMAPLTVFIFISSGNQWLDGAIKI